EGAVDRGVGGLGANPGRARDRRAGREGDRGHARCRAQAGVRPGQGDPRAAAPRMTSGLVDRHIAFLEALRGAGLSVSLAEDLDAVAALSALPWDRRDTVHAAYAATLVKKQSQRPTFDTLFDVYFPRLVGEGFR